MNEQLNELNSIIQLCESIVQYIEQHGVIRPGNTEYNTYKDKIETFILSNHIRHPQSVKLSLLVDIIDRYHFSGRYTVDIDEAQLILKAVIALKHELFPDYYEKVFISHSSCDSQSVLAFINLLCAIGIPSAKIFCSSASFSYLKNGARNFDEIKKCFNGHELTYYILWYTDNFFRSPACMNEVGAIWVKDGSYLEILFPNFEKSHIKGLLDKNRVPFYANDEARLNMFQEDIQKMFHLPPINYNYWESMRNSFIGQINSIANGAV